jgi:hypothetical protein
LCSGLLCEQVAVDVGLVKWGSVPKLAPIATPRDSVTKVSAGRVANNSVRRRLSGIEVQLEGVQESLRNSNDILLGGAIKFVKECMQHPGAAKFMEIEKIPRHTVFDAIFKMMVQEFRKTPPSCSRASAPTAEGPVGHFVVHPHPKRLQHASNISFFVIIAICDARCFSPCQH